MREVLEILEEDARTTAEDIAARLDMTVEEVADVIEELEGKRVIYKYKTMVDWERMGDARVYAFIEVRATPERGSGFDGLAEHIARFDEVHSLYLISGDYDLSIVVEGKSLRDIAEFVSERLSTLPQVQGTATRFVLKTYKLHGVSLIEETKEDKRLAVQA